MKYFFLITSLFIYNTICCQIKVVDKEFNFEFSFPSSYNKTVDETTTKENVSYICKQKDITLSVLSVKYDSLMYHSELSENLDFDLHYTQKEFIQKNEATLVNSMPKSILGYPGIEIEYKLRQTNKTVFKRIYLIKNQVIEIIFEGPIEYAYDQIIEKFFLTLKLVNVKKRAKPYLNLPSEEEIANRPYLVNFSGESKLKTQTGASFLGHISFVMEIREWEDYSSGMFGLIVMHAILPKNTSKEDKEKLIQEQIELTQLKSNCKIISTKNIENGFEIEFEYKLLTYTIRDRRKIFTSGDNYYTIVAMTRKDIPEDKIVPKFFDSFKLKE